MNRIAASLACALAFTACSDPASAPASATSAAPDTTAQPSTDGPQVIHTQDGGRMEGVLRAGKREGPWVAYGANGAVRSRSVYVDGLEEGPAEVFHENGLTYYTGQYAKGITVGEWVFYDPQGKEVKRVVYDSTGVQLRQVGG
jgi:hypothetical protein